MASPKRDAKNAPAKKAQRDVHIPRPGEPNRDQDEPRKLDQVPDQDKVDPTDEREIIRQNAKPRSSRQSLKGPNNRKESGSRR